GSDRTTPRAGGAHDHDRRNNHRSADGSGGKNGRLQRHHLSSGSSASPPRALWTKALRPAGGTLAFGPLVERQRISFNSRSGAASASARFIRSDASAP